MLVSLLKPHTHEQAALLPLMQVDMPNHDAEWCISRGIAEQVVVPAAPSAQSSQAKPKTEGQK